MNIPAQTYTMTISENQRQLIARCLRNLNPGFESNLTIEPSEFSDDLNASDDVTELVDLLDNMPDVERADPNVCHGLCY